MGADSLVLAKRSIESEWIIEHVYTGSLEPSMRFPVTKERSHQTEWFSECLAELDGPLEGARFLLPIVERSSTRLWSGGWRVPFSEQHLFGLFDSKFIAADGRVYVCGIMGARLTADPATPDWAALERSLVAVLKERGRLETAKGNPTQAERVAALRTLLEGYLSESRVEGHTFRHEQVNGKSYTISDAEHLLWSTLVALAEEAPAGKNALRGLLDLTENNLSEIQRIRVQQALEFSGTQAD